MEALPYNHALCERNVGNEATSPPECASPGPVGSTQLLRLHLAKQSFLPSLGLSLSQAMAARCYWHTPRWRKCIRLHIGYRFHHAVRQTQGVRGQSQNLCYEKNQKLIQIQHTNFLFRGKRRRTELTTSINSFGCWKRELEATQVQREKTLMNLNIKKIFIF